MTERNTEKETKGVTLLLGDPRKAIISLSLPMIVAMSVQTIYNVTDAIWVSGLGADALSAVGFFFPFFFMLMALATGIGTGGSSAVSRRIGARDKEGADAVAAHTVILVIILAGMMTPPFFVFSERIFSAMGAGRVTAMATVYARILFASIIIIFFSNVFNALLRGEGDATRAMYALMTGAGLNIVLDPLFIYTFRFGVAGAAIATVISMTVSFMILFYWIFIKKNTYISVRFRNFRFRKEIVTEILNVGLPSAMMQLSMSFSILFLNIIVVRAGGTDGVAVFTTGWRVATFASLPLMGIATAVVAVTGAAYGSSDYEKLDTAYLYAVKVGLLIELFIAGATYILAPQITMLFTLSEDAARISADLIAFLRIMCFYYPAISFGMLSSAVFQGTGKGVNALVVTIFRTIVLAAPLALVFSSVAGMGLSGVWWGVVAGNITGASSGFVWARLYIHRLKKERISKISEGTS